MKRLAVAALIACGCTDWNRLYGDCVDAGRCSDDAGGRDAGPPDAGFASLQDFCGQSLQMLCGMLERCGTMSSAGNCLDLFARGYKTTICENGWETIVLRTDAGTVDLRNVNACGAALRSTCTSVEDAPIECARLVVGTRPMGAACHHHDQCLPSLYCVTPSGTCGGTCVPRLSIGGQANSSRECVEGLFIDTIGGVPRCQARRSNGGLCDSFLECQPGLACGDGICANPRTTGCTNITQCAFGKACIGGECLPLLGVDAGCTLKLLGMSSLDVECQFDLHCDADTLGGQGRCRSPGSLGAGCILLTDCGTQLYCDGAVGRPDGGFTKGRCALRKNAGSLCAGSTTAPFVECVTSTFCSDAGTCVPFVGTGASCPGFGCVTGFECDGGVCRPLCLPP